MVKTIKNCSANAKLYSDIHGITKGLFTCKYLFYHILKDIICKESQIYIIKLYFIIFNKHEETIGLLGHFKISFFFLNFKHPTHTK